MYATRTGHGNRVVVLVHGFGTTHAVWRGVTPALVRARCTVWAADLLGHGESDRPLEVPLDAAAQARYLRDALAAKGVTRASFVGLDWGALVALALAVEEPSRVERLALVSPLLPELLPPAEVEELQRGTGAHALRLAREVAAAAVLIGPLLRRRAADPARITEALVARYTAPFVGRDGIRQLLALARVLDGAGAPVIDAASLRVPMLVVRGDTESRDPDHPVERFAAALSGARVEYLAGVGQLAPEEDPVALATLLVSFLTAGARPGASVDGPSKRRG